MEILGGNLKKFFDTVDNPPNDAEITYAGNEYEVWEVSDELHKRFEICSVSIVSIYNEDFRYYAGFTPVAPESIKTWEMVELELANPWYIHCAVLNSYVSPFLFSPNTIYFSFYLRTVSNLRSMLRVKQKLQPQRKSSRLSPKSPR